MQWLKINKNRKIWWLNKMLIQVYDIRKQIYVTLRLNETTMRAEPENAILNLILSELFTPNSLFNN